jgi:hypothetical protein
MLAVGVVALGAILVALLIALLVGVIVYAIGIYVLHAPQPAVGLIAFVIFLLILLYASGGFTK